MVVIHKIAKLLTIWIIMTGYMLLGADGPYINVILAVGLGVSLILGGVISFNVIYTKGEKHGPTNS